MSGVVTRTVRSEHPTKSRAWSETPAGPSTTIRSAAFSTPASPRRTSWSWKGVSVPRPGTPEPPGITETPVGAGRSTSSSSTRPATTWATERSALRPWRMWALPTPKSASNTTVRSPSCAKRWARAAARTDLPVPPFPLATASTRPARWAGFRSRHSRPWRASIRSDSSVTSWTVGSADRPADGPPGSTGQFAELLFREDRGLGSRAGRGGGPVDGQTEKTPEGGVEESVEGAAVADVLLELLGDEAAQVVRPHAEDGDEGARVPRLRVPVEEGDLEVRVEPPQRGDPLLPRRPEGGLEGGCGGSGQRPGLADAGEAPRASLPPGLEPRERQVESAERSDPLAEPIAEGGNHEEGSGRGGGVEPRLAQPLEERSRPGGPGHPVEEGEEEGVALLGTDEDEAGTARGVGGEEVDRDPVPDLEVGLEEEEPRLELVGVRPEMVEDLHLHEGGAAHGSPSRVLSPIPDRPPLRSGGAVRRPRAGILGAVLMRSMLPACAGAGKSGST